MTVHPLADQPAVVTSYAAFDQTRLHAGLFNGTELPGGGPWNNGWRVMPGALGAMVAAFNGGFKFKHLRGGYFTEGHIVKPLLDGEATMAISTSGRLVIGVYGQDMTNDGTWVSLRQNLPLIVDHGRDVTATAHEPGVAHIYWGNDFGGVVLNQRSALCQRDDGLLMYAEVGDVDIKALAAALVAASCSRAMELDINGSWPEFITVRRPSSARIVPVGLDLRMSHLDRYITGGSTKDFVALFDPALLPANTVR
jgi:Phosphodiester glycosidase